MFCSLACHCAAKAKANGYVAIALGFYGECHATKDRVSFEQLKKSPSELSNACVNVGFSTCQSSDRNCVGGSNAEYIYDFPSQAPPSRIYLLILLFLNKFYSILI